MLKALFVALSLVSALVLASCSTTSGTGYSMGPPDMSSNPDTNSGSPSPADNPNP